MKILIIGGTRFIGPYVVRGLVERGHDVSVFHRGQHKPDPHFPPNVEYVHGDRRDESPAARLLRDVRPDVVIDMIAFTRADAEFLVRTFAGVARRLVVPSSQDVYRAYGRLHRTEPGPPDPVPLDEDAPLREKQSIHGERYEKRDVEAVVMSHSAAPGTILRLPAVYGPGDYRLYEYVRRLLDRRPAIILEDRAAAWRWTYGYVENMAHAIVLAALDDRAAGRIYNVGESDEPLSTRQRVEDLAAVVNWSGRVIALPSDRLPPRLVEPLDWSQDWVTDSGRIRRELGYREVVPYDQGLTRMIAWMRNHPNEKFAPTREQYAEEDQIIARA